MTQAGQRMILNTRERIISTDHNRLQAFADRNEGEAARFGIDAVGQGANAGGVVDVNTAATNPLRGTILSGLLVRPTGTVDIAIDGGVVLMRDADAVPSADDSQLKRVIDPGLGTGTLTLTPGSGGVRVDVLECARIDLVTESDNRDVFDPATGLFTPIAVPKVASARLTYRIRTGSNGGGFAGVGTATGWMPLAVFVVGSAATDWTGVTIYDVRPLESDIRTSHHRVVDTNREHKGRLSFNAPTMMLSGEHEVESQGRALGGRFNDDLTNALSSGFIALANLPFVVWALTPFGLPRWCKYGSNLLPGGSRGVLCISNVQPTPYVGTPVATVALPTATGLGGSTQAGAAVGIGYCNTVPAIRSFRTKGWRTYPADHIAAAVLSGSGTADVVFGLTQAVHVPQGTRTVRLRFSILVSGLVASTATLINLQLHIRNAASATVLQDNFSINLGADTGGLGRMIWEYEIPLNDEHYSAGTVGVIDEVRVVCLNGGGITYSGQTATVVWYDQGQ